ncbi:MAG: lysylphosphatidylglycerol synthase domain-containing protein [Bacteroidales bacterium]|nr:lysylphosphatidylglycerol synthase domain-containing protein [Bacteroidales bacterium]
MNKTKVLKIAGIFIKILIIFLTFGFIYYEIFLRKDINNIITFFIDIDLSLIASTSLISAIVLMLANWFFEIKKWRLLMENLQELPFTKAFTGVFSGITVSTFTPNRTGEYAGRVFVLNYENRWKGVVLTIAGSLSQLSSTLIFGFAAFFFFLPLIEISQSNLYIIKFTLFLLILTVLWIFFNIPKFYSILMYLRIFKRYDRYLAVLKQIQTIQLAKILSYSILRHLIFSTQFYLLLIFFGLEISFAESIMLTSIVFLIITIIPTVALAEMGIRGAVSIFIFGFYFTDKTYNIELITLSASFFLWVINLVIPALIGSLLITRLNFFKNK